MLQADFFEAFQNDPNHPLRLVLADNDVYDWAPTAPTTMYYCTEDEQVDYNNSLVALETMLANGAQNVEALNGGPFDHGGCAPLAFLGGYFFFEEYRTSPFSLDYEVNVSDATSGDANDGMLEFVLLEGQGLYTLDWSTGENEPVIAGLSPGDYTLNIIDAMGCSSTGTYSVSFVGDVFEEARLWNLYPNPSSGQVNIEWPFEEGSFKVRNAQGKVVQIGQIKKGMNTYSCENLKDGMYTVEITSMQASCSRRIMIMR
jgi:hypothetical protein